MKTKLFLLFFALTVSVLNCNAQTDSAFYLNKTMEKLKSGDCDVARKFYNVYKEVYNNNKPVASIEALLANCKKESYAVGETMTVDGEVYVVAYTRDGGKHGLAVCDKGWDNLYGDNYTKFVTRKGIPTLEELKMIHSNKDIIRFYGIYWTCSRKDFPYGSSPDAYYYVVDFSTGVTDYKAKKDDNGIILLIHRF